MADATIGDKEKVQILLAEYSSLRGEINSRISSAYTVVSIAAGFIAWMLTQRQYDIRFWIGAFTVLLGATLCGWFVGRDCVNAGRRVQELENEINMRAGETLLIWENEKGGLAAGYWQFGLMRKLVRRKK